MEEKLFINNGGDMPGAQLELLGANGNLIGRFVSEEERNRAIAEMQANKVKKLNSWKQLDDLRKNQLFIKKLFFLIIK